MVIPLRRPTHTYVHVFVKRAKNRETNAAQTNMGVARIYDWGGPMYDVVEIVQFLPRDALQSKARSC